MLGFAAYKIFLLLLAASLASLIITALLCVLKLRTAWMVSAGITAVEIALTAYAYVFIWGFSWFG
jgi:hypothetical protein